MSFLKHRDICPSRNRDYRMLVINTQIVCARVCTYICVCVHTCVCVWEREMAVSLWIERLQLKVEAGSSAANTANYAVLDVLAPGHTPSKMIGVYDETVENQLVLNVYLCVTWSRAERLWISTNLSFSSPFVWPHTLPAPSKLPLPRTLTDGDSVTKFYCPLIPDFKKKIVLIFTYTVTLLQKRCNFSEKIHTFLLTI